MSDETSALRSLLAKVAAAPASTPAPCDGDIIGRYEIVRPLGEGGFGTVFEARDRDLGRNVALKLFRISPDGEDHADWVAREARAIARLSHPNIVTLLDHGEYEGQPYLVLELVRGRTLADALRDGALGVERALTIAQGIARALSHAHASRVIHLDLKPSNIVIGEDDHVTVLDFGLARFLAPHPGASTTMTLASTASSLRGAGTPAFMAPEQASGDADARTDVFATGILLYAMLTGELPFALDAASVERVLRPSFATLRALRPRVPDSLVAVLQRALAENPANRFADGAELLTALRDVSSRPRSPPPLLPVIAIAVIACTVTGASVYLVARRETPKPQGPWHLSLSPQRTWVDSTIDVTAGQTIVVRATGHVCTKGSELCAGPDGQARVDAEVAISGLGATGIGMLVGKIGSHAFPLGANRVLPAPATGRLELGINDADGANNTGSGFDVTIELR